MINHLHLIASGNDMIGFIRDFKKHTSKEMQNNIIATEPGVLRLFDLGDGKYEFWSKTNMPKMIKSEEYIIQKINYVHANPVRRQYVKKPEDWMWSSANPDSDIVIEPLVL